MPDISFLTHDEIRELDEANLYKLLFEDPIEESDEYTDMDESDPVSFAIASVLGAAFLVFNTEDEEKSVVFAAKLIDVLKVRLFEIVNSSIVYAFNPSAD